MALGREWLVREALQKKELIVPFNLVFPAPRDLYVVSTRKGIQRPKVRLFHDWIWKGPAFEAIRQRGSLRWGRVEARHTGGGGRKPF